MNPSQSDMVECLRQVRASILGWRPDEPTPMRHQMALALQRINRVLYGEDTYKSSSQKKQDDPNANSQMPQKWREHLACLEDRKAYPWAAIDQDGELARYRFKPGEPVELPGSPGYFSRQGRTYRHVADLSPEEMKRIDDWRQTVYLIPQEDAFRC